MPTPRPPAPKSIKQDDLQQVLNQRLEVETLKRSLKHAEDELLKTEVLLIDRLEHQAVVQPGELDAVLEVKPGAKRPAWKEELARLCGPTEVERIQRECPPSPASTKLVVTMAGKIIKSA